MKMCARHLGEAQQGPRAGEPCALCEVEAAKAEIETWKARTFLARAESAALFHDLVSSTCKHLVDRKDGRSTFCGKPSIGYATDDAQAGLCAQHVIHPSERGRTLSAAAHGIVTMLGEMTDRLAQMALVPCAARWKTPMKCLPTDPCSFCRVRAMDEQLRDAARAAGFDQA